MYTGDMIVNLYLHDRWRTDNCFNTRVVFPSDSGRVIEFVKEEFPSEKGWVMEVEHALHEGKCIISIVNNQIAGFACYDCSGKGYFGPLGVAEQYRKLGIGTELVYECFDQMKCAGYGYSIIGWVDDTAKEFYEKVANAVYIPASEPNHTLYMRRIRTAMEFGDDASWNKVHHKRKTIIINDSKTVRPISEIESMYPNCKVLVACTNNTKQSGYAHCVSTDFDSHRALCVEWKRLLERDIPCVVVGNLVNLDFENEERLTWDEICDKYPNKWVGLVNIEYGTNQVTEQSAVVKYVEDTREILDLMMISSDSKFISRYTSPETGILQSLQEDDRAENCKK